MALTTDTIDERIIAAAKRNYGASEAAVCRYVEPANLYTRREEATWFLLSVRHPGDDWQLVGRRKTKSELLQMVSAMGAAQAPEIQVLGLA